MMLKLLSGARFVPGLRIKRKMAALVISTTYTTPEVPIPLLSAQLTIRASIGICCRTLMSTLTKQPAVPYRVKVVMKRFRRGDYQAKHTYGSCSANVP